MTMSSASCDTCRKRKVKCDRLKPCSNCRLRDITCYTSTDSARPRGRQGGRRSKDAIELQARLARLEALIDTVAARTEVLQLPTPDTPGDVDGNTVGKDVLPCDQLHHYVAGPVWSQLSTQIEGLREVLLPSSDEEESALSTTNPPSPPDAPTQFDLLLCSNPSRLLVLTPEALRHPSLSMRQRLFSTYCDNVDPLCKIIHCPTVQSQIDSIHTSAEASRDEAGIHATLFAIYGAAIISLPNDKYSQLMDEPKDGVLRRFRFATEYFLSKADYMESRRCEPLQAFTIYLLVVRAQDPGQRHWAFTALAIQLAKGLGLHSMRSNNNFEPLERELRLRLWHVLRIIDFRAALDRGMEPIIKQDSYDTSLPSDLNDEDLTEAMTVLPLPRKNLTDMSFSIVVFEGLSMMLKLYHLQTHYTTTDFPSDIWTHRLGLVNEYESSMNSRFSQHCDSQIPYQWQIIYVINVISEYCRLLAVRPMSRFSDQSMPRPMESSRQVLERALRSLRAEGLFFSAEPSKGFRWYAWVHWYVLAVALVELLATPQLMYEDAIWHIVSTAYQRQRQLVADTADGPLWRPLKKLMERAEHIRLNFPDLSNIRNNSIQAAPKPTPLPPAPDIPYDVSIPPESTTYDMIDAFTQPFDIWGMIATGTQDAASDTMHMPATNDSFLYWDQFLGDFTNVDSNSVWM